MSLSAALAVELTPSEEGLIAMAFLDGRPILWHLLAAELADRLTLAYERLGSLPSRWARELSMEALLVYGMACH